MVKFHLGLKVNYQDTGSLNEGKGLEELSEERSRLQIRLDLEDVLEVLKVCSEIIRERGAYRLDFIRKSKLMMKTGLEVL